MIYDLAIVGAGPAGMSAAIYGSRGQLNTILFGDETKGNLYKSHLIANYLAFPNAITGPELTKLSIKHATSFGATHQKNEIIDITINQDGTFQLKDNLQNTHQSKTVIIATGQSYVLSGIRGEKEFTGKGVSYCVTCDGYFYKNKKVIVIGNGDFAADEALQLLSYTNDITVLSHGKDFQINDTFLDDLQKNNIKMIRTSRLGLINGEEKITGVTSIEPLANGNSFFEAEGIFMAIGQAGANAFSKKLGLEMDGNFIKTDKNGKTNIKGLFAAGDCTGSPPQVASSVGSGCNAALSAIKLIRNLSNYIQY